MPKEKKPLELFYSPLTGRVYATRHAKRVEEDGNEFKFIVDGPKDDVTESFFLCMAAHCVEAAKEIKIKREGN